MSAEKQVIVAASDRRRAEPQYFVARPVENPVDNLCFLCLRPVDNSAPACEDCMTDYNHQIGGIDGLA